MHCRNKLNVLVKMISLISTGFLFFPAFASLLSAQTKPDFKKFSFIKSKNKINSQVLGYWKSIGNGYILKINTDSVLLYSYTSAFCYKEKNDYLEGLYNSESRFYKSGDTLRILPTDYGEKTAGLQITQVFTRIEKLPEKTLSFSEMQQMDSRKLFQLFIETLKENYAFSQERHMNWDSVKKIYEKQVSDTTTHSKLFEIFGEIVTLTGDHHTKIIAENGKTLQYRGTRSAETVSKHFNSQSEIKNLNEYFNIFFQRNYKNISDTILKGNGTKLANGQLEFGDLTDSIGYLHIYSFTGFAQKGFSRKQQIDSLIFSMNKVLNQFKNKSAILIDVSFNFGGYDAAALCIAGFFTRKPVFAYTSQVYTGGNFYNESNVYVYPSARSAFTKPVYLLMTDITRSAAESFAMMMNSLPNVILVGTNTMGILSGMLGKSIGEYYSTSSNQRFLDSKNKYYEVTGLFPDIRKEVFGKDDIFRSHMNSVKEITEIIERDLEETHN